MVEVQQHFVNLSHGRTRYLEAGEGFPTFLLHGVDFTGGGHRWLPNIPALATRLRVIAPDFVGWGVGDRLDLEYSFGYLVDFVRELQDALGVAKTNVVGHSMGGWVATVLAYESPERVNRLVLVDAGGTATRPLKSMTEFQAPTKEQLAAQLRSVGGLTGRPLEARLQAEWSLVTEPNIAAYRRIMAHMTHPLNRHRYNTVRRLAHLKAPTLILWGAEDQVNGLEMAKTLHEGIRGSRLQVVPGCGHFLPAECPEQFNKAVLKFLVTSGPDALPSLGRPRSDRPLV